MEKTTIKDIARQTGVGVGTVSRVLNNSIHVSDETRKKVLAVIKEQNYIPSSAAIHLARRSKNATTIGILLPDISNHFFFEIFEVIYKELRAKGIDILIFNYEDHYVEVINRILDSAISMLLIFNFQLDDEEKALLLNRNVPYLYVDSPVMSERCIYTDNQWGGMLAGNYLLSKGVKSPCYVADMQNSKSSKARLKGFKKAFEAEGITDIGIYQSYIEEESGNTIALEIINSGKYDGIFCFCDEIASGVVRALRKQQSNIQVIGFDGLQISRYLEFSTISQQPRKIGSMVSEIVTQVLTNELDMNDMIVRKIQPELVDRNS